MMKKNFVSAFVALSVAFVSGCTMCNSPIPGDQSCIEPSHASNLLMTPCPLSFTAPKIASCTDVFQPTFRAGDKRITVTGVGKSLDEATNDAVSKFLETANCDFVVAVSRRVALKTHPTWRFFATTNYSVTFSGLPIYIDKLVKLPPVAQKVVPLPQPPPQPPITKEVVINLIKLAIAENNKCQSPFGLLKLILIT